MGRALLNDALPRAAAALGYADLVARTQSIKRLPSGRFKQAQFPALQIKVGYALHGERQEAKLADGKASDTVEIDISFNEPPPRIQILSMTGGRELRAYSLISLVAEFYEALPWSD